MVASLVKEVPIARKHKRGVITEVVHQNYQWRVNFDATYWFAESEQPTPLHPGDVVAIIGKENTTTLLVQPL